MTIIWAIGLVALGVHLVCGLVYLAATLAIHDPNKGGSVSYTISQDP